MAKIISSQHYIDPEIVERKMLEIANETVVHIPCYDAGIIDGVEYAVQADGHHTLAAARELEISVVFDIADHPEKLTGDQLLADCFMDGDWYNVETSNPYYYDFDLTF